MIKFLFKALIIVVLLIIIIPLTMLLFGESALVYKIFGWSFLDDDKEKTEVVMSDDKETSKENFITSIKNWANEKARNAGDASATVKNIYIEHNVVRDGEHGMNLYSKQNYKNLKGINCYSMLRFFDDEGKPLKGKDEYGEFSITGKVVPDDNDCENDQRIFVPYDLFDLPESGTVYFLCDIRLFIVNNEGERIELANSSPCRFHLTK